VPKVDLLYLVNRWGKKLNNHVKEIIDNFDHPMGITLIGNGAGLTVEQAKESLKELAELKNIKIKRFPQKLDPVIAYRKAAKESCAKFLFLVTPNLQAVKAPRRIFVGVDILENDPKLNAIRWNVPGEEKEKTQFECLIYRDYFLFNTKPSKKKTVMVPAVTMAIPKGFKFDAMYSEYQRLIKEKDYQRARSLLHAILRENKGFPHIQYLIRDLEEIAYALDDYKLYEEMLFHLIERGYIPDNYMRLSRLKKHQGRYSEAIEAGLKAMESLGIDYESFDYDCFPIKMPHELGAFKLFMDIGDSSLKLRRFGDAARAYHVASKIKSDSYKPFLGFAKTYLEAGELLRAEAALTRLPGTEGQKDPETHRLLSSICRSHKNLPLAFDCLLKAFEHGPGDEENVEPFYFVGGSLKRYREMAEPLRTFVSLKPDHSGAWGRLSSVHFNLGEEALAREAAEKCLSLDPKSPVAKSILSRIKQGRIPKAEAPAVQVVPEAQAEVLPALLDQTAIVW
jgi:tetratricopeptide (TPR) repeat protein